MVRFTVYNSKFTKTENDGTGFSNTVVDFNGGDKSSLSIKFSKFISGIWL